jgi:PKD repeat protein
LHEALHVLGFGSQVGASGNSLQGFYTLYDLHLTNVSGDAMILPSAGTGDCCLEYAFNAAFFPDMPNPILSCGKVVYDVAQSPPVHGQYSFTPPLSDALAANILSHLSILCGSENYVMHASISTGATAPDGTPNIRRELTAAEVSIMCTLGYEMGAQCDAECFVIVQDDGPFILNEPEETLPYAWLTANDFDAEGNYQVQFDFTCGSIGNMTFVPNNQTGEVTVTLNNTPFGEYGFCYTIFSCDGELCQSGTVTFIVAEEIDPSVCLGEDCNLVNYGDFEFFPVGIGVYYPSFAAPWNTQFIAIPGANLDNSVDIFEQGGNQYVRFIRCSGCSEENLLVPLCETIPANCGVNVVFDACVDNSQNGNQPVTLGVWGLSQLPAIDPASGYRTLPNTTVCNGVLFDVNGTPIGTCLGEVSLSGCNSQQVSFTSYSINFPNGYSQPIQYIWFFDNPSYPNAFTQVFMDNVVVTTDCRNEIALTPTVVEACSGGQAVIEFDVCLDGEINTPADISIEVDLQGIPGVSFGANNTDFINGVATIEDLQPGECVTLTLFLDISPNFTPGTEITIPLNVDADGACIENPEEQSFTFTIQEPLTIQKSYEDNPATGELTFYIEVCNEHTAVVDNIEVTDVLAPQFTVTDLNGFALSGNTLSQVISLPAGSPTAPSCLILSFKAEWNTCHCNNITNCAVASTIESGCGDVTTCIEIEGNVENPDAAFTSTANCLTVNFMSEVENDCDSHLWNFGDSQTSNSPNPSHTYLAGGTYQVTHTVTNDCGTITETVNVTVTNCTPQGFTCPCTNGINIGAPGQTTLLSSLGYNGTLPSGCIAIAGTFVVNQTLMVSGSEFRMQPGSQIIVKNNSVFTVNTSNLHGCEKMWKGINVEGGSSIYFDNNYILDAQYSIFALQSSNLSVKNCDFDKDFIGIYTFGTPTLLDNLQNNTFTCSGSLLPPYTGQSPNPGTTTYTAFYLINTNGFDIGVETNAGIVNSITGIRNGVVAVNSTFNLHHVNMQGLVGAADTPFPWSTSGIGLLMRNCPFVRATNNSIQTTFRGASVYNSNFELEHNTVYSELSGIVVWSGANRSMKINDNTVIVNRQQQGGADGISVMYSPSAQLVEIHDNTVKVSILLPYAGSGIYAYESSPAVPGEASIFNDNVEVTNGPVGIFLNTTANWNITDNDVTVYGGTQYTRGINIAYSNSHLRRNYVTGEGITNYTGIFIGSSPGVVLCCNTVDKVKYGLQVYGSCSSAVVATTQFNTHYQGLFYHPSGFTGPQFWTGNEWHVDCLDWDALHQGGFIAATQSQYWVSLSQAPNDYDPLQMFVAVENGETTCANWTDCGVPEWLLAPDGDESDGIIASGELEAFQYGEVLQWTAEQQLYRKLSANPALLVGNEQLQLFKSSRDEGTIGQLYAIRFAIENAWKYPAALAQQMKGYLQSIQTAVSELDQLNALLVGASTEEKAVILQQRSILVDGLKRATNKYRQLDNSFRSDLVSSFTEIMSDNENLSMSFFPASNEKTVNHFQLQFAIGGGESFSNEELDALLNIATQCPLVGGDAVYRARGLYQILSGIIVAWETYDDCPPPIGHRSSDVVQKSQVQKTVMAKIFPNPTNEELFVEVTVEENVTGKIQFYDLSGKLLLSSDISSPKSRISTREIPPGLYFVRIKREGEVILIEKLVILH